MFHSRVKKMVFKRLKIRQEADVVNLISRGIHARAPETGRDLEQRIRNSFNMKALKAARAFDI